GQRERGGAGDEWEALLLAALLVLLGAPLLASFGVPATLALGLVLGAFLVSLAVLARPPLPTEGLARLRTGSFPLVAHAIAAVTLVNVVLFPWSLASRVLMFALGAILFAWLPRPACN